MASDNLDMHFTGPLIGAILMQQTDRLSLSMDRKISFAGELFRTVAGNSHSPRDKLSIRRFRAVGVRRRTIADQPDDRRSALTDGPSSSVARHLDLFQIGASSATAVRAIMRASAIA